MQGRLSPNVQKPLLGSIALFIVAGCGSEPATSDSGSAGEPCHVDGTCDAGSVCSPGSACDGDGGPPAIDAPAIEPVVDAGPPTPSGACRANEPDGFTPLTDNDFTSIPGPGWWGPFELSGVLTIEEEPTPSGDGRFARNTMHAGWTFEDTATTVGYVFPTPPSEIYLCLIARVPESFQWGAAGQKLGYRVNDSSIGNESGPIILSVREFIEWEGGAYRWEVGVGDVDPDGNRYLTNNVSEGWVQAGDWVVIEVRAKHTSGPSANDGEYEMWIDGTRTAFYDDVAWTAVSGGAQRWSGTKWDTNRNVLTPTEHEDWLDWDRLYVSGRGF